MHAVVIDDLDAALAHLTALGQELTTPVVEKIREVALEDALQQGWPVVSHQSFVDWVSIGRDDASLHLIADKIFPTHALSVPAIIVDVHRAWEFVRTNSHWSELHMQIAGPLDRILSGTDVVLLDDAAYTGKTLHHIRNTVIQRGGHLRQALFFVTRSQVIQQCEELGIKVECLHLVPPSSDILHLRDYFPWLPYSGRRISGRERLPTDPQELDFRLAHAWHKHGAWLHLHDKHPLLQSLHMACSDWISRFDASLGRQATVRDLTLLGDGVSVALAEPWQTVTAGTPLHALLP